MATAEDERAKDESSDLSSSGESDSGEAEEVEEVEWLVNAREKRSTAGNRMKSMLATEEPAADDSDLELLFAEDEDDAGFTDVEKEDASDVQMDSSSDEEDQADAGDELEGETELQRAAKAKKTAQRKRKAHDAIPMKFRKKKVRIEQPATGSQSPASSAAATGPLPRPKKKSERTSWLPTAAELPTRASERHTTRLSKEQLHQQMVEREVKRKKQMEMLEKKAKRLEALKKPPMTQAERLEAAAAVEKRNAKSLNRWEEAEKQREEERLRKIAALNNRKLDGPVVTFWSGIQELEEGQLKHVGKMVSIEEKAPRKKRQSTAATITAQQEGDVVKTEPGSKPTPPVDTAAEKPAGDEKAAKPAASTAPVPPEASSAPAEPVSSTATAPAPATPAPPPPTLSPPTAQVPVLAAPSPPPPPPTLSPPTVQTPVLAAPSPPPPALSPPTAQAPVLAAPSPPPPPPPTAASLASSLSPPIGQPKSALALPAPQSSFMPPRGSMAPPPIPPPPEMKSRAPGCLAAPVMMSPGAAPPMLGGHMPALGFPSQAAKSNVLAAPNTTQGASPPSSLAPPSRPSPPQAPPATTPCAPAPSQPVSAPLQPTQAKTPPKAAEPAQEAAPEPPLEGKVTKSCIILQNFDENAIKDRQVQTQILFGRKMNKLASKYLFLKLSSIHMEKGGWRLIMMSFRTRPPSSLRHHQPPGSIPGPQNGSAILQQLRLPRDTTTAPRRLQVEPPTRRLDWQWYLRGEGGTGAFPKSVGGEEEADAGEGYAPGWRGDQSERK